jgi:LPS export ABC transporter protein LptC
MYAAGAKYPSKIIWPLLLAGILLTSACENDLKKIQEISGSQVNMLIDTVHGVDVIYSDSARVKARMLAPIMLESQGKDPYNEMPKGVNIIFYDKNLVQEGTLKSDYAIRHDNTKTTVFRKNVVATNAKGETFTSEELVWDEANKLMHSDKVVQIRMANGDIINGTGFQSDQGMEHWTLNQSTGTFSVTDSEEQ